MAVTTGELRMLEQIPFTILGETPDLLAIEKPPFLLVHPSKPDGPVTLWDHLKELLAYEIASGGQVSLINRLDRETSGIVLVAKHPRAARACALSLIHISSLTTDCAFPALRPVPRERYWVNRPSEPACVQEMRSPL